MLAETCRVLRYRLRGRWHHRSRSEWPLRRWLVVTAGVATAVGVAGGTLRDARPADHTHLAALAASTLRALVTVPVVDGRHRRDDYERTAFGSPWTDATAVADSDNGCDTRNDILTRDLSDTRSGPVASCPHAVLAGELRSPYTGAVVIFRRDRRATAIQIDHIVPLAFAWDMGAFAWPPARRADLANDPANLVAVDGDSNQDKSDSEPGRWMPPNTGFHCQYAIQFVDVLTAYGLQVDRSSRDVLTRALQQC